MHGRVILSDDEGARSVFGGATFHRCLRVSASRTCIANEQAGIHAGIASRRSAIDGRTLLPFFSYIQLLVIGHTSPGKATSSS